MDFSRIGKIFKNIRQSKEMSFADVANRAPDPGITIACLSAIERGVHENPNINTLERICFALEVPLPIVFILSSTEEEISELEHILPNVRDSIRGFTEDFGGIL